MTPGNYKMTG